MCVCHVYVLEPLNRTPHVSRKAAAGASIWVAKLLVFSPFFLVTISLTNSCLGNGKARAHAVERGADSAQQRRQGLMQAQSSFLLAHL